jgi:hypothetical protein
MMASADAVKNNAVYAGFREICACAAEIGKCAREGDSEGIVIATSRMKKNFEQIVATLVFGEPKV